MVPYENDAEMDVGVDEIEMSCFFDPSIRDGLLATRMGGGDGPVVGNCGGYTSVGLLKFDQATFV